MRREPCLFRAYTPLIRVSSEHYGEEFWIECVDTSTDEVLGASLLSVHGLMLSKREAARWFPQSGEDRRNEGINPRLLLRRKAQSSPNEQVGKCRREFLLALRYANVYRSYLRCCCRLG